LKTGCLNFENIPPGLNPINKSSQFWNISVKVKKFWSSHFFHKFQKSQLLNVLVRLSNYISENILNNWSIHLQFQT
jgi:hypothetical protein